MGTPETAAETLAGFDRKFAALEAMVDHLDEHALTEVCDPAGWTVKDHLMNVAQWEQALLAKVDGRPRHEALGIDATRSLHRTAAWRFVLVAAGSGGRPVRGGRAVPAAVGELGVRVMTRDESPRSPGPTACRRLAP